MGLLGTWEVLFHLANVPKRCFSTVKKEIEKTQWAKSPYRSIFDNMALFQAIIWRFCPLRSCAT